MKTNHKVEIAHKFIQEFFSNCKGALMLKSKQDYYFEILIFYNQIPFYNQKVFQYHKQKIQILLTSYGDVIGMLRKNMVNVTDKFTALKTSDFVLDLIDKHEKMVELLKKVYPNMVIAR